jgi:uncharacterized membrane protein
MLFTTPDALAHLAAPWAKRYSHSKVVSTIVVFLHIAPLVVGGGIAIALDRSTLRLRHDEPGARARHLAELGSVHRLVITGLAVSIISGIGLLAADLDTFLGSWVFWLKMALVALLLVNGLMMTRLETRLGAPSGGTEEQWGRLRVVAITSLSLWLVTTFLGVVLTNIA